MLMTEWNWDDAMAVRYEDGRADEKLEIARSALAKGSTPEFVQEITGLDLEKIKDMRN